MNDDLSPDPVVASAIEVSGRESDAGPVSAVGPHRFRASRRRRHVPQSPLSRPGERVVFDYRDEAVDRVEVVAVPGTVAPTVPSGPTPELQAAPTRSVGFATEG